MNTYHCIAITAQNGAQSLFTVGKGRNKRPCCFISKDYTLNEIKRLRLDFPQHEYEYASLTTALNFFKQ